MHRQFSRKLIVESLEARQLLAVDLHNFLTPMDVNDDGRISSMDALLIINELNAKDRSDSGDSRTTNFVDVNDDGRVSALDALTVINALNRRNLDAPQDSGEWIRITGDDSTQAAVQFKPGRDGIELEIRVRGTVEEQSHAVFLEDSWIGAIELDERGRGHFQLRPSEGLDGKLPDLLAADRSLVHLKIEGVGDIYLRNDSAEDLRSTQHDNSQRMSPSSVFGTRLIKDGEPLGHTLFAQHGQRQLLSVYARGFSPGTMVPVTVNRVEVAVLRANSAGVIIGRIDTTLHETFPAVQAGTRIQVGDYMGEFVALSDRSRPDPPRDIYVAQFLREGVVGRAELLLSEDRTVLNLRLGRVEPNSVHGIFIDDVKIAEVRAGRAGVIEYRYDSRNGDTLLARIPTLHRESVLRVGEISRARLVKIVGA